MRWAYIFLAAFLFLYGVFSLTNLQLENGKFVLGGLALVSGICFAFSLGSRWSTWDQRL